ncbi:GNAT family N-acetyltransferase [Pseudoalteromonas tunicata]|uniref:GNAT family N-acetyltransferase n=1 Tax=Pseudoalteromonas tunicata TaxID=314281 RepID=UPI00273DD04B|nr:GNAT family N-acetyltransferase [Pseudoalteromonas tunicata]MDP4982470.1 GNAT family N-acetyltransferase [Pseudoalteromonas tunicata]MDP5214534.1 GNAT family N-acetyltransferase [Pseudoalteromonas tunicata]
MNSNSITILEGSITHMLEIELAIPEFTAPKTANDLARKLNNRQSLLLIAYHQAKPVAYKLGYQLNENTFYSWLGAVLPEFRGQGIAKQLLLAQESWVKAQGFMAIEVKSMNRFKTMLQMLIAHDYHIISCKPAQQSTEVKIRFRKQLG